MPRRRGFTLLELIVVVAIIAMLSAVAIPRFGRSLARERCAAASRRIVADLALARRVAQARSATITVAFSDNTGYAIAGLADRNRVGSAYSVSLVKEPYLMTTVKASFGGATSVSFDAYGVPNSAGAIRVGAGEYQYNVTLDVNSGVASSDAP